MKFRKKPVEIEAVIWDGYNVKEILNFCKGSLGASNAEYRFVNDDKKEMFIKTLEGEHHASVGDYIIKGVKGEFYPCKPDIFIMTYNKVE